MKFKNILFMLFIIGFLNFKLFGQATQNRKAFIAINSGCYLPTSNDFNKIYGDIVFINGISIGIPFTNQDFYVYGKGTYFKKEGMPIIYHYTNENGISRIYTTQEGTVTINHFQFNIGLQHNMVLSNNFKLITNGGLSMIKSTEKSENPIQYESKGNGLSGFFLGVGLEKEFLMIPSSLFTEFQYSPSFAILKNYNLNYSSITLQIGLKYYFNQTRE